METESVTLNPKEQQRLMVVAEVANGQETAVRAAERLGLSEREVRRKVKAYRANGAAGLAHGNRGRKPANTTPPEQRRKIVALGLGRYRGRNWAHMRDLLEERDGVVTSRSSVRRFVGAAGGESPRQVRRPAHRQRRERRRREGSLSQTDESPHRWFGPDAPPASLIAFIDDATGKVQGAIFREHEDTMGYLLALEQVVRTYGCPRAVYHDRHTLFGPPEAPETVEEQLAGRRDAGQMEGVLEELGIRSISAGSPQAKGRIERHWGTQQDRLVAEFALDGVTDIVAGNAALPAALARHNARFAEAPAEPDLAYLPPPDVPLEQIFCFTYHRKVANDNTVAFAGRRIDLPPGPQRQSYAGRRVEVHHRFDGSLAVFSRGVCLATLPAAPGTPEPQPRRDGRPRAPRSTYPVNVIPTVQWTAVSSATTAATPRRDPERRASRQPAKSSAVGVPFSPEAGGGVPGAGGVATSQSSMTSPAVASPTELHATAVTVRLLTAQQLCGGIALLGVTVRGTEPPTDAAHKAPPVQTAVSAGAGPRPPRRPAPTHPWRRTVVRPKVTDVPTHPPRPRPRGAPEPVGATSLSGPPPSIVSTHAADPTTTETASANSAQDSCT